MMVCEPDKAPEYLRPGFPVTIRPGRMDAFIIVREVVGVVRGVGWVVINSKGQYCLVKGSYLEAEVSFL